eukprot:2216796-Pyramimonas_sp.AAC.1
MLKLASIMVYVLFDGEHRHLLLRARWNFCFVPNRRVVVLAWKVKSGLNSDRLGFEVHMVSGVCSCAVDNTGMPPRARVRRFVLAIN